MGYWVNCKMVFLEHSNANAIIIWESMKVSLSQLVGISIWKNMEVFPDLGLN